MAFKIIQYGFNYSQDGPGNRLVYHLQGCNLHCPWCSNPEGIPIEGCLMQVGELPPDVPCPHGSIQNGKLSRNFCTSCRDRQCLLPYNSHLKWSCSSLLEENILTEIERSRMMFFDGGGVTFTGGEATLQFEPLKSLLEKLKQRGIHTALETNGTNPRLPELFPLVDWLIMDCKHYDNVIHQEVLGLSGAQVKRNLQKARTEREQLLVRIPLINGFNASEEDAQGFAALFHSLGIDTVELLRYHEYGKDKWLQCGLNYQVENGYLSDSQYRQFVSTLKRNGISCIRT